jgi:hypothetical protein
VPRRLADECDAAQERGGAVGPHDGYKKMKRVTNSDALATTADYGLTRQEIHRARQIRYAEKRDPGVVRQAVDAAVKAGKEPKAGIRKATGKAPQRPNKPKQRARPRI